MATTKPEGDYVVDPIFKNSLREARMILSLWACCFVYTVTYCYLFGFMSHEPLPNAVGPTIGELVGPLESFNRDPKSLSYPLGLGIPDWVFYGVALPWVVCIVLSFVYALFIFAEDDLSDGAKDDEQKTEAMEA